MSEYSQVNWEKAQCRQEEIYPDLFYQIEEERSTKAYEFIDALRSICTSCPIWKDCLTYAMRNEDYGMWGGMTTQERISMRNPNQYPNQRIRALSTFRKHGISWADIKECL